MASHVPAANAAPIQVGQIRQGGPDQCKNRKFLIVQQWDTQSFTIVPFSLADNLGAVGDYRLTSTTPDCRVLCLWNAMVLPVIELATSRVLAAVTRARLFEVNEALAHFLHQVSSTTGEGLPAKFKESLQMHSPNWRALSIQVEEMEFFKLWRKGSRIHTIQTRTILRAQSPRCRRRHAGLAEAM